MKRYLACATAGLACVGAATVLYCVDPAVTPWLPPCLFRLFTGLNCPGCGSLRAAHAVLHGDLLEAFGLNPLLIASAPVMAAILVVDHFLPVGKRLASRPAFPIVVLAIVLAYWVLRNVPLHPFTLLAPH